LTGKVRPASAADAAAIAQIYAPYVRDTVISFEEVPPSADEMAARMADVVRTHPYLVFEAAGEVLGYAYAGPHASRAAYRWSADVSVYVAARAHRHGVGRELYTVLLDLLRQQGFHAAFAGVTLPNAGSVGLHEALGFSPIGGFPEAGFKHGAWHDVGWWRLALSDGPPAGEPIAFPELAGGA